MRILSGPCAVLEPAEAGRLLVAARRGTGPLRAAQGALPAGVDRVLGILAGPLPVLSGDQAAIVAALIRAGGVDVGGMLGELDECARQHRYTEDRRRLTREAAGRIGTEYLFRNKFAEMPPTRDDLISTAEAAEKFNVSAGYLRRLARQRRIEGEARPAGEGGWLLRTEDVEDFFAQRRGPGRPRRADTENAQANEDRPAA